MREKEYHKAVGGWLSQSFTDVEHEVRLPSGRRPDFIAHTPFHSYVIEVENSWSNHDIKDGLGQAQIYGAETGFVPVLVFPADDVDEGDLTLLDAYEYAPIIETV